MPIDDIDECTRKVFETHVHPIKRGITRENIHPRLRGLLMMIESNDSGPLLISCGNKTEIALGYATLYGDMCGGVSVIGDLSKKNVYRVARYVNELHGRPVIPERTFTIKPSAELAEGQYDPFDYSIVSDIVDEFTERRRSPRDLLARFRAGTLDFGLDDEGKSVYDKHTAESFEALLKELYRQFRISVPKRLQGAPVISATERSFGFDLREPIINKWEGY